MNNLEEGIPYSWFTREMPASSLLIYSYSFAELCDRLQIVTLKIIASTGKNESLEKEQGDILHDIQYHLRRTPMNAEMIKAFTVLAFVNKFIFDNETFVRDADSCAEQIDATTLLNKLKASHKANSLRAASKKHIQNQRGERVDEKLNYGKEDGFWNIQY